MTISNASREVEKGIKLLCVSYCIWEYGYQYNIRIQQFNHAKWFVNMMNGAKENSKFNIHCKAWSRLQLQKQYKEYQQWWRHCDENTKMNNWTTKWVYRLIWNYVTYEPLHNKVIRQEGYNGEFKIQRNKMFNIVVIEYTKWWNIATNKCK